MPIYDIEYFYVYLCTQILKKDLYFDPEFWNLIALRTNCLKLLSKEVVSSALEEIMEDKWILKYCAKETTPPSSKSVYRKGSKGARPTPKRSRKGDRLKEDLTGPSKRLRLGPGKTLFNVDHTVKRKNNQASRTVKGRSSEPLRRSFWQLDRLKDSRGYEDRRITRLSEKNPPKRRIRTPRWLLEDSGTLEKKKSKRKIKKHRLKYQKHHEVSPEKVSEAIQIKNNAKQKPYPNSNSESLTRETNSKHQKGFSVEGFRPASPPQMILELSLPDNELFGTFSEDPCYRQRGLPQVLFYKPTMKHANTTQPVKTVHRKEVILRTRDLAMFVQQLHCYTRRLKGKGSGTSVRGSVSKITRSSAKGMPSKVPEKSRRRDTAPEDKDAFVSPLPTAEEAMECSVLEKAQSIQTGCQKSSLGREHCKKKGASDSQSKPEALADAPQDASTDHLLQTRSSKHREEVATQLKVSNILQGAAENQLPEAPVFEKGKRVQTQEPCEESAVEMKVTFASKTATASKLLDSSVSDKVLISSSADVSVVSRGLTEESSLSNTAGAIPMTTQSHHCVLLDEKRLELRSLPSHLNPGCPEVDSKVNSSISSTVTSVKLSDGHATFTNYARAQGKVFNATPPGSDSLNDMSDFQEMLSKQMAPDVSKDFTHEKSHTTSSCSVSEQRISAGDDSHWKDEDLDSESTFNAEPVESEESRLEFCCTFCKKVFNGSRVVAHAMFHFRKDECMFCGTMFKDDLLAMMHLSDHIEKLKKSKELAGNKVQEKRLCDTKDDSIPNSSTKAKTIDIAAGNRRRGRPRKTAIATKPVRHETRRLRSSVETRVPPCLEEEQEHELKNLDTRTPGHKMNGNVGKNTVLERLKMVILNSKAKQPRIQKIVQKGNGGKKLQESLESSERQKVTKTTSKHNGKVQEKNMEPQQPVVCPVEGCTWALDLSKNRVALLYHALEDHDGDIRPLKLAFCIGNGKCSICMRVLWSFEHFQHHVERHRLAPRHPCLHQGCTARFKTGMEMRRHTRKHSPLQAVCCLPGCSELFICLWALNLHEREHYSSKSTKPDKNTNRKKCNVPSEKDQQDSDTGDSAAVDEMVCVKAPRQSRGEPVSKLTEKLKMEESVPKRDVLKNLSNKETSKQPAVPNLRLRRETKAHVTSQKYRALLKNTCSAFLKRKLKARHKFKRQLKMRKIPTKRELPPKLKEGVKLLKEKSETSNNGSEPKKSVKRKFKNPIKQNGGLHSSSMPVEKKYLKLSSRLSRSKRQNVEGSNQTTLRASEEGNVKDQAEKSHELLSNTPSGEQSKKLTAVESKTLLFTKKSKRNRQNVAELKRNKRKQSHVSNQKDGSKTSSKIAKLTFEDENVEDTTDKEAGIKQEIFNPRSDHCGTTVTALPESSLKAMVPPSPATEESRKEATSLEETCVRNSDSKNVNEDHNVTSVGETKAAMDKDGDAQEMVSESSGAEGGSPSSQVVPPGAKSHNQSVKMNGQVALCSNSSVCIETLAEYGKKPYMRPPPTAYLDEKYTTMPKRRKELTFSHSERIPVQKEARAVQQRQRCVNCFATFSSTDELQVHLLLQKCSNLFGFDSDDEGEFLHNILKEVLRSCFATLFECMHHVIDWRCSLSGNS